MTKLEQLARALAVHQFGSPDSWEDQIPMARVAVEALRGSIKLNAVWDENRTTVGNWDAALDAILSEKPE